MKEPYGKGAANHPDPEPYAVSREVGGGAMARARIGWVFSIPTVSRLLALVRSRTPEKIDSIGLLVRRWTSVRSASSASAGAHRQLFCRALGVGGQCPECDRAILLTELLDEQWATS
jgi:hypothetical protein